MKRRWSSKLASVQNATQGLFMGGAPKMHDLRQRHCPKIRHDICWEVSEIAAHVGLLTTHRDAHQFGIAQLLYSPPARPIRGP
jgi:hypothetical protein